MNRGIKLSFAMSLGFCALSGASLVALSSPRLSATEITATATANATVSVAEACTMQSGSSTDTPHTATIPAGTNKSDIGQTTFKVICNDTAGFSVYAVGFANYEVGNTKLLATVGGTLNPTYDIETGLNMTNTTSSWAMKLTPVSGTYAPTITTGYTDYHVVPSTNTKVATYAGVTDGGNNANGSAFTATYRANISGTQPAGNYNGKVKYTMVHPATAVPVDPLNKTDCPANSICYAPNSYDVIGTMDPVSSTKIASSATAGVQTGVSSNSTATLIAPNYYRQGYGFAGWSTDFEATNSSVIYGPNETVSTNPEDINSLDVSTNGAVLYPVWVTSVGYFQDWDYNNDCAALPQSTFDSETGKMITSLDNVTALTDRRDENTYAIAHLADDRCWMIENLRLNSENTTGEDNKNLSQGYSRLFIGLANSEDENYDNTAVSNSLYKCDGSGDVYGVGGAIRTDIKGTGYCAFAFPRYNRNNTNIGGNNSYGNPLVASPTNNTDTAQWYSYGNYYDWNAAIADTTYYQHESVLTTSICPSRWNLPTATNFRDYSVAMGGTNTSMGSSSTPTGATMSTRLRSYPNNYIYAGLFYESSAQSRGSQGRYISSTTSAWGGEQPIRLLITNTWVHPNYSSTENGSGRIPGFSVRCLIVEK